MLTRARRRLTSYLLSSGAKEFSALSSSRSEWWPTATTGMSEGSFSPCREADSIE